MVVWRVVWPSIEYHFPPFVVIKWNLNVAIRERRNLLISTVALTIHLNNLINYWSTLKEQFSFLYIGLEIALVKFIRYYGM